MANNYDKLLQIISFAKGINFEVYKGERLGIIGGNGLGKSTFLKVLSLIYFLRSMMLPVFSNSIYFNIFKVEFPYFEIFAQRSRYHTHRCGVLLHDSVCVVVYVVAQQSI